MRIGAIVEAFRDWRDRRAAFKEIRDQEADMAPYRGFEIGIILNRVKAAAFQENHDATIAAWHELNAVAPELAMTSTSVLRALMHVGEAEFADELLVKAQLAYPTVGELAQLYAEAAQRRGQWEEANRRWENVRKRFPEIRSSYTFGSICLLELGRFDEAEKALEHGLRLASDDSMALFQYARAAEKRENWEQAYQRWLVARERLTEDVTPSVEAARCLKHMGRDDEAIELLEKARWRYQSSFLPGQELARIPHDRGDWEAAWKQWDALRVAYPRAPGAYVFGAEALNNLGRHDEAEALLLRGADRFQETEETGPMFAYAVSAHNRRDWPEAARRWAIMRDWYPTARQGYKWGGDALEFAGDLAGAEEVRERGALLGA